MGYTFYLNVVEAEAMGIVQKKLIDGFGICKGALLFEEENEGHGEFW